MAIKLRPEAYDVNEYGGKDYQRDVRPLYSPGFNARVDDMIAAGRLLKPAEDKRSTGNGKEAKQKGRGNHRGRTRKKALVRTDK